MRKIPQALLDKYRDVHVDGIKWWTHIWYQEQTELEEMGFTGHDFRFSGFGSQGDGASYTGFVFDFDKFWKAFDPKENYMMLRKAPFVEIALTRHQSMHCHEFTVYADVQANGWWFDYRECDPFKEALYDAWNKKLDQEVIEFENEFTCYMRDRMRALYRKLEEEYEHLTSDEVVAEWIIENASDELEEAA